jgi:hypothetical protein
MREIIEKTFFYKVTDFNDSAKMLFPFLFHFAGFIILLNASLSDHLPLGVLKRKRIASP